VNLLKRIALRANLVALLAVAMGTCLPMKALAQDIAASFPSNTTVPSAVNPNGVWSYGSYTESSSTFALFTATNATACGLPNLSGVAGGFPVVVGNNTGASVSCGSWTLPTDTLNMHPTDTAGVDSDVRWTAPAPGTYMISGNYLALDSTTTLDSILVNGTSMFSTNIDSSNPSASFSLMETLSTGSTIDFTVNCCSGADQDYDNDSTGLDGTISANTVVTPEPPTFFLVLGASALLLPLIRRRLL
jgi:hypothetical protein